MSLWLNPCDKGAEDCPKNSQWGSVRADFNYLLPAALYLSATSRLNRTDYFPRPSIRATLRNIFKNCVHFEKKVKLWRLQLPTPRLIYTLQNALCRWVSETNWSAVLSPLVIPLVSLHLPISFWTNLAKSSKFVFVFLSSVFLYLSHHCVYVLKEKLLPFKWNQVRSH